MSVTVTSAYRLKQTTTVNWVDDNIEHAVHHMALVKIGLRDVAPRVTLPAGFGIVVSTLRHQERVLAHN